MPRRALALCLAPWLTLSLAPAACTDIPAIDARIPPAERTGPPPPLQPLGPLLARADAVPAPDPAPALAARQAALAARAAGLRGPVLTAAEEDRLAEDID